ncbi:hypothetical protein [Alloacidobacterium sp.]|uniref:hypothetical protein n=1 Tax=Alloacidobacterium sp. TaxID=2951999 RepID=UPI002D63341A|nr:hypothetical protein [Alloacidobacterium sp.]HYK37391.1 hypothetical protein [Alloacidobacterium sp.]
MPFMNCWRSFPLIVALFCGAIAHAVTCTTQSQLTDAQRTAYEQAIRGLAAEIQSGNVAAVKAEAIPSVAAQFDSIAGAIQAVSPTIQGAVLTIQSIFSLRATDLKSAQDTQFFCSVPGSQLLINISIPQLPPSDYAFTVVHATGIKQPQQISMILENEPEGSSQWKLAGLFVRPLSAAGHDGVWYWTQARAYANKRQSWNAYFYYQTAAYLLSPVDFISSPNLDKLQKEMSGVRPDGLPGAEPMKIVANGQAFDITNMHTDGSLGGLDLVVNYKTNDVSDPVATRSRNIDVMKALLAQHAEIREAFHGLWVYADAEGQRPFAIELPMNQIQ